MEKHSSKANTRQRILDEAARVMRETGTEGIGVAALMKRVGLTHGGFYAHFASREELVEEVLKHMFAEADIVKPPQSVTQPAQQLADFIDSYLSEAHRNTPAQGCPLAALMSEVAHLPHPTRQIFAQGCNAMHASLTQMLQALRLPDAETLASSMMAEMTGALALARANPDAEQASLMLQRSRTALKQRTLEVAA
ncbi:TetR/AcrR family transcriptional regulator [Pantoea sp. GD03673]|uniref:TetR/AcrR family transcriptional regulator n=1 Tax=Pantoea sp. GD03673 TaxID=2975364 RepID=UPI002446DC95|nr:TetR/AcrR family transcriptional regulator [Pantoea sp. GD03673]MDH2068314.1 TetR/AcrR family transcriptional regulator [Pantoea sp. GD03673]